MNEPLADRGWWEPGRFADRRPFLRVRSAINRGLRDWFEVGDFVEVETPLAQLSPGNEVHLHAPAIDLHNSAGIARRRFLRTSPEFACKKLLAAGETRIVEFARVFRDREEGPLHLPEFTMLEWYRANALYKAAIDDSVAIIVEAGRIAGTGAFRFRGRSADLSLPAQQLTVAEAFSEFAGVDLLATISDGVGDREALTAATAGRIGIAADDDWSDIFSKLLVALVEPNLGNGCITVLTDYPAPEAALAQLSAGDRRVAERFEVYACGVELANGYGELNDPAVQYARFEAAMVERERRYGERYPIDDDLIEAIGLMPPACGVALGLDRLVMLAAGATRIDQVIWTPLP
jgi:lysyl-tRNA synthetase class 2